VSEPAFFELAHLHSALLDFISARTSCAVRRQIHIHTMKTQALVLCLLAVAASCQSLGVLPICLVILCLTLSLPCSQASVCVCFGLYASNCHGAVTNSAHCFFFGIDVEALDSPKVVEDVVYETGTARCPASSVPRVKSSASLALPPKRFADCVGRRAQRR